MSYDISLYGGDVSQSFIKIQEGGTQLLGGTQEFQLNVTYNYSKYYYEYLDEEQGIRWLYGKKAKDTQLRLEIAIAKIMRLPYINADDYWSITPTNAIKPLRIFVRWCQENPNGVWNGD